MQPSTIVALALLVASTTATAQVHRCTGPDGKTVYSDKPCTGAGGQVRLTDNSAAAVRPAPVERSTDQAPVPPRQAAKPTCPDDQELRNLEAAATAITPPKAAREQRAMERDAARACRANGTSYAEELRALQASAATRAEQRRSAARTAEEGPALLGNCDTAGCWDTQGRRYDRAAGGMFRSDGKFCTRVGQQVNCN